MKNHSEAPSPDRAEAVPRPGRPASDLSQILGCTGDFENPRCLDAIQAIAKASAAAGKSWGVFSRGPAYAERLREWGCRLFVLGADIHAVHAGIRDVKARYGAFFPPRG